MKKNKEEIKEEVKEGLKDNEIISAADYLSMTEIWNEIKEKNFDVKDRKRLIEIKNLQIQIMQYEVRNIQYEIKNINDNIESLKNRNKELSIELSEKYNINLFEGALDPITREWRSDKALKENTIDYRKSELEALEEASKVK